MHHRVLRVCVGLDVARGGAAVGHRAPQCWQGEAEGTAQVKKLGGSSRQEKENQKNTVGKNGFDWKSLVSLRESKSLKL